MKTIEEVFRTIYKELKEARTDSPHLEAGWIIEKYTGLDTIGRIQKSREAITQNVYKQIRQATDRRKTGEPLAYILEEKEFFGRIFYVNSDVLIPRPDTEVLVEWAIRWAEKNKKNQAMSILDLGTGSGCIGLTLLAEIPNSSLSVVEKSKKAMAVAKRNAERMNVLGDVEFILLDAARADHLMNRFDLIVANPPYIAPNDSAIDPMVKVHEPHEALYSDDNGLKDITEWFRAGLKVMKKNSAMGFEVGAAQGERVFALFRDSGAFSHQYTIKDYAGHDRVVCGER